MWEGIIFENLKVGLGRLLRNSGQSFIFGDFISVLFLMAYATVLEHISLSSFVSKVGENSWERGIELALCPGVCLLEDGYL